MLPILGLPIFITAAREKSGAYGREFPTNAKSVWASLTKSGRKAFAGHVEELTRIAGINIVNR